MDDRCIMENLLLTTKGVCDLYLHGTIESSTQNVHQAFDQALDDSLCMQDDIYKKMSAGCNRVRADREDKPPGILRKVPGGLSCCQDGNFKYIQ